MRSDWFLAFHERFPTPARLTELDREAFVDAAWNVVGSKVTSGCFSRPLRDGGIVYRASGVRDLPGEHPDYRRLCTIPGISPINALTAMAEAGEPSSLSPSPPVTEILRA